MKRGIIYIALVCVSVYIGIINREKVYFYAAVFMLAAAVCLIAGLWLAACDTRLEMKMNIPVVEKNKAFRPELSVTSAPGRLPYVSADFKAVSAGVRKRYRSVWKAAADSAGSCLCSMSLSVSGRYRIQVSNVRIYDSLRLFYIRRKVRETAVVYVLPECFPIPVTVTKKTRDFVTDSDVYYADVRGDDSTETIQIREYQPGDRMMSIHWKLSARQDEIMVRETSKAWSCPVIICMNLNGSDAANYGQAMSVALDAMVSLSFSMIDVRVPHFIAWYDTEAMDLTRYRILREEDVYDAAAELSYVDAASGTDRNVIELYRQKYCGEEYTSFIDIDMRGNVSCGDAAFHVDFQTERKDMSRIYITV